MPWGAIIGAVAGDESSPSGVGSIAYGVYQMSEADKMMDALAGTQTPRYKETPEMTISRMRADQLASGGFSAQEKAAFSQMISRSNNTMATRSAAAGANGQVASSAINYGSHNAWADWAMKDAELHRNNIQYADSFSKNLQDISNLNTANEYSENRQAWEEAGKAKSKGMENIIGGMAGGTASGGMSQDKGGQKEVSPTGEMPSGELGVNGEGAIDSGINGIDTQTPGAGYKSADPQNQLNPNEGIYIT